MKRIQEGVKVKLMIGGGIIAIIAVILFGMFMSYRQNKYIQNTNPELARAMEYPVIEDKEAEAAVEGTNYVQFDAFFLRDINQDGYAESIRGTCKEVGEEDTLYMNLNVLTNGYLKDGKITINSNNFYLQTAIPKDNEIKENAIGNNIKEISLNDIKNGTQKLITGIVHSGDYTQTSKKSAAIGNNKDNYSKINSVTITGTHVADDGTETQISKTVDFTIDWYGETKASISNTNQTKDIEDLVDEENGVAKVSFSVTLNETAGELIPNKANISGEIPELNGYTASKVTVTGPNVGFSYTYDKTTRRFSATVESETNISKSISITVNVEYPIEAYRSLGQETLELKIPVEGYYECYNNPNEEFDNPIQSNVAEATVILNYRKPQGSTARVDVTIGKQLYSPNARYMVSKEKPLKIYNGVSNEEEDRYIVRWDLSSGSTAKDREVTLQETTGDEFIKTNADTESMEEEVSNVGIYFSSPLSLLGNDGWIKVYNDETGELIETFTKDNWDKYSSNNPYMYETKIKHIRIETSKVNTESSISIYHVKELDDEYITTNKTIEEFNSLQYIKSTLEGYFGKDLINKDTHQANYEAPMSVATMSLSKTTISTQETEKNIKITLKADGDVNNNKSLWKDGAFLVKLPKDILDVEINNVELNTNSVQIASYETYEEDGINYIKILTENENASSYTITIDCNLTADPRIATTTESFEMYASNEENENYYNKGQDIYDVNGNLNTKENVAKVSANMSLVSPNSLLTNETASEFDADGNITIAPKVAETTKEQRTAKVNIELNNNYSSTISEVQILGRVPFEGNKYVLNGEDLESTFTVSMSEEGIIIPEKLKNIAKVYYSENGEATNDLGDTANGWTETPADFSKVKSYLIDLGDYVLEKGEKHTVSYNINIPEGINYNQVSYSAHAVYFSLDTDEGKYKTQSEPNKVGFMIAKQYDLEIVKYQKERENKIGGATYSVQEEGTDEIRTKVTDANGSLVVDGLYVDRTYILKEIKSPSEYELNTEEIRFVVNEDNEKLVVNVINGTTREVNVIEPQEGQDYRVQIKVEDEVKARLKIKKVEEGTDTGIRNVKFKITGENLPENGKILTTNSNGEIEVSGLKIGSIYTLEETKAEGYYLSEPIVFSINRGDRIYYFDIQQGTLEDIETTEENNIPVVNIKIANTKIPRYNLEINKVVKGETTPIEGVKFKLFKQDEELGTYETDENGKITINDLYQYEESRGIDQTYILKETYAPEGYAKIKDIVFNAETKDGTIQINVTEGNVKESTTEGNTIKITVEDSKSFKLTKKDGETAEVLPGVKFAIYNVEEGSEPAKNSKGEIIGTKETINGKEYYVVTTNENGEIAEDLPEGLYKAVEVEADEKYDITGQEYYFGIGASREGERIEEYSKTIDTLGGYALSIEGTSDGGFAVIEGSSLCKYNEKDELEWSSTITPSNFGSITDLSQIADGGYVVVGYTYGAAISIDEVTLQQPNSIAGFIINYTSNGEVEDAKLLDGQGSSEERITSIDATTDGGYIISGYYENYESGKDIIIEGQKLEEYGNEDIFIIKYNDKNEMEWINTLGGPGNEHINSIVEIKSGDFIAGGYFNDESITIDDMVINNTKTDYDDAILIKYNESGVLKNVSQIGGEGNQYVNSVEGTSDGGYIVGGYFAGDTNIGEQILDSQGIQDGLVVKYDKNDEVEWIRNVGGNLNEEISSITELNDGSYIAVGYSESKRIVAGNITIESNAPGLISGRYPEGIIINYTSSGHEEWGKSNGSRLNNDYNNSVDAITDGSFAIAVQGEFDGVLKMKLTTKIERVPEIQELTVKNNRKEFKITTDVKEINGEKGGSISGENENPYEIVKYGDSSTKEIVMTPEDGYEIIGITINGKEWPFTANEYGTYTMSQFTNITEDKHIEVTYTLASNKFTISKVDSKTKEAIPRVIFKIQKIDSIEENAIEIITNSEGKGITTLEYGEYNITEIQTADGYKLIENPIIVNFTRDGNNIVENNNNINVTVNELEEFVIENEEKAKVIVHHYIKGTTDKVAEDEYMEGEAGKEYSTSPRLDIEKYELEKDEDGEYILPDNATGTYESGTQEVIYYYVPKQIPLTVHHYIEGTTEEVPLANGNNAEDEIYKGTEGEKYTTNAISANELDSKYELVAIPSNANGTYEFNEIEVIYYYRLKQSNLKIIKTDIDGNRLQGAEFEMKNKDTNSVLKGITDENGEINQSISIGDYVITETRAPEGYKLNKNPIDIEVNLNENAEVTVTDEKIHYADLIINKTDKDTGEKLANVEFGMYYVDQYGEEHYEYYSTDENGQIIIEGLEDGIEYSIKEANYTTAQMDIEREINKDSGYATNNEIYNFEIVYENGEYKVESNNSTLQNATIDRNQISINIENVQRLKVIKQDENGNRLQGAKFVILDEDENIVYEDAQGNPLGTEEYINGEYVNVLTTNENGEILAKLNSGNYTLFEVEAPNGYKLNSEPKNIRLEEDKQSIITLENRKLEYALFNINKIDSETKEKLSGVEFELTYISGETGREETTTYTTDENGTISISNLELGTEYTLEETSPYPGYIGKNEKYVFKVEKKNSSYELNMLNSQFDNVEVNENQITVEIQNSPSFKLIKEGTRGERVEGAKFTITDEEGNTVVDGNNNLVGEVEEINGEALRVLTTDVDGKIVENLLPGRYVVTEVQAPEGYEMPENEEDRTQVIEIKSSQVVTVSKEKELRLDEILNNLNDIFDSDSFQVLNIGAYNNGIIIYGILADSLIIPKEYTTSGEEIKLEKGGELGSSLTLYINIEGKIEKINYIKSDSNSFAYTTIGAENRNNETMAVGIYINSIKIPADKTESGEEIILTYSGTTDGIPGGLYLISYNANNKVKFVKDITFMGDLVDSITSPTDHRMYAVNDNYVIEAYSSSDILTVPAEETVDNKELTINIIEGNPIMLVLNSEGKVINAKEEKEETSLEDNIDEILGSTSTSTGTIVSGASLNTVTIPAEETVNGEDIILEKDENSMAIGVMAKYNEVGKIEWVNKISNGYNVYIYEVSDGYISIGMYVNELTIAKEDTANGQEITLTGSEQQLMLIKNNNLGQVVWAMNMDMEDLQKFDGLPQITETQEGFVISDYYNSGNSIFYKETNQNTIPIEPVEITITNKTLETLNVPVSKIWDDESNKLGKRPESVIFKLTGSDGSEYTKELTVPGTEGSTTTKDSNNENKWNDIFESLPRFDQNGNRITYTLTEEEKTEGDLQYYDTSIDAENNIITNTSKYGKVTVHYYIQNPDGTLTTNRVPDTNGTEIQDIIIEGKEGDEYSTEPAENVSDKYELVEEKLPANAEGTLEKYNEEKPQEVIYYYRLKPAKVIINYLEKDSDSNDNNNQVLSEPEEINGYVDDKYNTDTNHKKQTIVKDGKTYTLVENSKNTEGTMTVEDINVTYYYLQNTKATVRYVERNPETHEIIRDLEEPRTEEGLVGDEFVTTEKAFTGYRLVEEPKDKTIEMAKEEQTLIYYYEPITTGLVENHIDDITGKVLYTETHNVQVGQSYNIPSKEFAGYDLVESKLPSNSTGTMGEELVTVNYYYIKKAVLEVNYIDRATGEPLAEQIVDETKHEGDSYTTVEKTFEGYELIEEPENANGTMEVEVDADGNIVNNRTVVTYYYGKPAEIEEHHVDILTKEELEKPTIHKGYVGEKYNIPSKEFLSYVVAVDDGQGNNMLPTNAKGKYTEEKQVVTYYYYQPAKVIVHYVDMTTGKELQETNEETGKLQSSQVVMEGSKDLVYTTTAKEFLYYTLVQRPEQEEGTMKVEITKDENGKDIVNNTIDVYYYYEPKSFNIGVDKTISKVTVNGEEQNISNNKLTRVEIYRKNVNDTKVEIEYTIKVTNNGEVDGKAIIREDIPDGMSVVNNDKTWDEKEGYLEKVIPEIKAGETKEYKITLAWNKGDRNLGEKDNKVEITQTDNIPGFKDNNDQDNSSEARVLINVSTGSIPWPLVIGLLALVGLEGVTLSYARILTNKQKKNRK